MTLNKKDQTELKQVYDTWLQSYLNGDVKTYDFYLDKDYRFIGSTDNEEFLNKKETTRFFKKTADQLAGKTDLKNTVRTVELIDGVAFVTELFDAYFLIGKDWKFYSRFRFTSALSKKKIGWRFIYQHFSMPDSKAQEGETLGAEQISKENQELRDAIKRRTIELEEKNRELEIEAALEKVRSSALAMNKPDDMVEVCRVISDQLELLGVTNIRNVQTVIIGQNKEAYQNYQYYAAYKKGIVEKIEADKHPLVLAMVKEIRKSARAFFTGVTQGKKLQSFRDYRKKDKQFPDPLLDKTKAVHYFFYSIGSGALGLSTYEPINKEGLAVFKRFHKVFTFAYQRFVDLEKAIAQAREAQIEAALERVRSKSMAMHKSDELREVVSVIYEQLDALNFEATACNIIIMNKQTREMQYWVSGFTQDIYPESYHVPHLDHPYLNAQFDAWQRKDKYAVFEYTGKGKISFDKLFFTKTAFKKVPNEAKRKMKGLKKVKLSTAFFTYGAIQVLGPEPLKEENVNTLQRLAKVFEQTYTRFLDLQKAEEQARESEIELALERVRARTMAMQYSDELADVATVLFQQVKELGIPQWTCGFNIWETGDTEFTFYPGGPDGEILPSSKVPLNEHPIFRQFDESRKRGDELFIYEKKGEVQADHYRYMHSLPGIGDMLQGMLDQGLEFPEFQIDHIANFAYGNIVFITYEPFPEMHDVFIRFAKVFEQTYTRFLDLQKAEAQAREAQIEASLERVRSHAMAIRKSDELIEVIQIIFQEMEKLGFDIMECSIVIYDINPKDFIYWTSSFGDSALPSSYKLQYIDHPVMSDLIKDLEIGVQYRSGKFSGKVLKTWWDRVFTESDFKNSPKEYIESWKKVKQLFYSQAAMSHGFLEFLGSTPLPEDKVEVLKRFTKVVDLAYTRYDDVVKAEAQAREAQIEAALEKVRSRSLAMHTTNELGEVVATLVEKLKDLDVVLDANGVVLCTYFNDSRNVIHWIASPDFTFAGSYLLPYFKHPIFDDAWESKESSSEYFSKAYSKEEKDSFFKYAFEHSDYKNFPEDFKQWVFQNDQHILSFAWQKNSAILIPSHTGVVPSEEDVVILKRFTKVFEQAYIRFLDLQKAETQTRTAQIEIALERTRTQSMLMQHSDDLNEVSKIFHEQLLELHIPSEFSYVWLPNEENNDHMFWAAWSENTAGTTTTKSKAIIYDLDKSEPYTAACFKAWASNQLVHISHIPSGEIDKFFATWKELLQGAKKLKPRFFKDGIYYAEAYMKYGCFGINIRRELNKEEQQILERFSTEFERTYTRFLHLQKAEKQAREGEIELALERVRARTMAMQKGDELKEVVVLLYKELIALGINNFVTCGYVEINEKINRQFTWVTNPGGDSLELFYLPLAGDATFDERYAAWKQQQIIFHQTVAGEVRSKHLDYAITTFNSKEAEEMVLSQFPDPCVFYCFNFSHGYLHLVTGSKLKNQEELLLARFTRVFEQTYARFLDLQKAEEQAREAQIENALEKVRSRTMAMQHSDELPEAANNLFLQVQALGIPAWSAGYCIWEDDSKKSAWCNMSSEGEIQKGFSLPTIGEGYNFYKPFNNNEPFHVAELGGKKLVKHYDFMKKLPIVGEVLEGFDKKGIALPTFQIFHIVYFTHGYLMFITYEAVPNEWDIFKRFGNVFEQTYTRFLDLQKAEALAVKAKEDLVKIKTEKKRAEDALTELRSTQKQLIQSEKMASLGELTAGIAHEIQNPLNFVNNFSELSEEMVEELAEEIKDNSDEIVIEIMTDLKQNLHKITNHGKRASSIVKGMLEHSRTTRGNKELTDINTLADEFLRLSYHGLRAKDKSFNAAFKTDFDTSLPKVNIVAQDLGRVILNLINNAFYACTERSRSTSDNNYKPMVTVSTSTFKSPSGDLGVEIRVKDNGSGIPDKIKDKIFQPFFTTKPTGSGTGLGLSLAYDIITKGHGGELKVKSKPEKYTEFIIVLPLK